MQSWLARRFTFLAWLAFAAFIVGQLGALHWFAELFSHFVPHYAAVFALTTFLLRGRGRYLCATLALALTAWTLLPFRTDPPSDDATRLVWYNVHLDNPDAAGESARLVTSGADIVALAEINLRYPDWQALRQHYPHGCALADDSPFALAVFARTPLVACEVIFLADYPAIRAALPDGRVLYATHPPPPINAELARARIAYLQALAARIAAEEHALLLGDLNSSPYSPHYRALLREGGLRASTRNFTPTWLPLGLNLDHALLHNGRAHTIALPWHSSDHRPLQIDWEKP